MFPDASHALALHFVPVLALTTTFLLFAVLSYRNDCAPEVYLALYLSARGQWQEVLL